MISCLFKLSPTNHSLTNYVYVIFTCTEDFALQGLICHKTLPNQSNQTFTISVAKRQDLSSCAPSYKNIAKHLTRINEVKANKDEMSV